jgi:hypothetical protein
MTNRLVMIAVAATLLSCSAVALPTAATAAYHETTTVSWGPGTHLRVYFSDGGNIVERAWDGNGWYNGTFKEAGQSASATAWTDSVVHIRVYVTNGASITEYGWDNLGPWYKGAFTP